MAEQTWYIKQCRLFEQLSPEQLGRLEANARVRAFPKNATVYHPTDESQSVFVLLRGRVRLCSYTPDGKQAILAFIEPGELFGELALMHSEGYEDHAETMIPSTVASIPKGNVDRLLAESAPFSLGVTKFISWRRRRIERRLRSLLFRSNRDRLVHLLLDLVEQYGRPAEGGTLIDIRLSHQELANIIGSTRESVTVLLGELQTQRYLTISRQRLVMRDPQRLATDLGVVEFRPRPSDASRERNGSVAAAVPIRKPVDSRD